MEIHLYDFDGTLFRSPAPPTGFPPGKWYQSPISLSPPCIPIRPGPDWWINKTLSAASKSIANSDVWAIVCTGRLSTPGLRYRVAELLKSKGLRFDQVFLRPGGRTQSFKIKTLESLLKKHPGVTRVQIWEDNLKDLAIFCKAVEATGRECTPHPVKVPPKEAECSLEEVEHAMEGSRKASESISRLAHSLTREAVGTEEGITRNIKAFEKAAKEFQEVHDRGIRFKREGTNVALRNWANDSWQRLMRNGLIIADGIITTRSTPRKFAKGIEMAYRLYDRSNKMPKDVYKWWKTNKKRIDLTILAAKTWPEKQNGTDDLFTVGSFKVHNVVGVTGTELETFKKALAAAEKMVRKNSVPGFTKVLYGDIYYVGNIGNAHHQAWYSPKEDVLYIRPPKKRWGLDGAQTIVHELGHRYWRKFAAKDKKQAWGLHHLDTGSKPVKVEVIMPEVGETLPIRLRGTPRGWEPTVESRTKSEYWYRWPSGALDSILVFAVWKILRREQNDEVNALKYPTAYSATNEEEHFCDALKMIAAKKLPADHVEPFGEIWG